VCTAANTVAHSRFTFTERDPLSWRTAVLGALAVLATSLVLTTAALAAVDAVFPHSTLAQLVALVAASAVAALIRFVLLRAWMFHSHLRAGPERATAQRRLGVAQIPGARAAPHPVAAPLAGRPSESGAGPSVPDAP